MAKILVNYIYSKAKDEYKILNSDFVYADQKVAVLETEDEINNPLIVSNSNNIMIVVDREQYEKEHKKFYLIADEKGNVSEHPNGAEVWLPKDTNVSKLKIVNGRLVMVEEPDNEQEENPKNEVVDSKPKKTKTK